MGIQLTDLTFLNRDTKMMASIFLGNQANSADLTIYGYNPSKVRNHTLRNLETEVEFSSNGREEWELSRQYLR